MGEFLTDIVEWMSSLPALWAYATILAIAYGENVLPPIPGDMIIVFGGYMVGIDELDFVPVLLLATAGGSLGFMTMYVFGNRIAHRVSKKGPPRWVPARRLERSREMLTRWGDGLILANRFLPGLRSVISISVGMADKPAGKTTFYATLSALVWSVLLVLLGVAFGENWETVSVYLRTYGSVVFALVIGFAVIQLFLSYRSRRRVVTQSLSSGHEEPGSATVNSNDPGNP